MMSHYCIERLSDELLRVGKSHNGLIIVTIVGRCARRSVVFVCARMTLLLPYRYGYGQSAGKGLVLGNQASHQSGLLHFSRSRCGCCCCGSLLRLVVVARCCGSLLWLVVVARCCYCHLIVEVGVESIVMKMTVSWTNTLFHYLD
jgi:hypothetical protein